MSGLRWGILSTGNIAHRFAGDLRDAGLEVVAVGASSLEKAQAFAAEFGIGAAYGSYEELFADPHVDIVYVATPHTFHARNALMALRHDKHVLVEKPFTLNRAQADAVVAEARSRGLLVQEAMWTRFLPHMVRIRHLVDSGVIGRVRAVLADHSQKLPSDPEHRLNDPALGGGALLDLGVYPVSFAWDLLGEPETVTASATMTPTGVDAQTAIVLGYPDGEQAVLHCSLEVAGANRAEVLGTEGRVLIEGTWYAPTSFRVISNDGEEIESWDEEVGGVGMQFQALAVEEVVAAGRSLTDELPAEESARIMGTLDAVRAQIGLRYPDES